MNSTIFLAAGITDTLAIDHDWLADAVSAIPMYRAVLAVKAMFVREEVPVPVATAELQ